MTDRLSNLAGCLSLRVPAAVAEAMAAAAREAAPFEACGFLLGGAGPEGPEADCLVLADSSGDRGDSFTIPEPEMRRLRAVAASRGRQLVALFHSHPHGDGKASRGDLAALSHSPWPWVIAGCGREGGGPVLHAYRSGSGAPMRVVVSD